MPVTARSTRGRIACMRALRAILVVAVAVGWWTALPVRVSAAGNCTSPLNNSWLAGWQSNTTPANEPEGVWATLTYRQAASCQFGLLFNAGYSGWVMLAGNNQQHEYAQAGFIFDGNPLGCIRHFSEYNLNFILPTQKTGSCVSDGEVHQPRVQYIPGTGGHVRMYIDSTLFDETSFCICSFARPYQAQFYGESHDLNGDVPGLAATRTDWNAMKIQFLTVNTWHDTCGVIALHRVVQTSRYDSVAPNCDHIQSWTATP
jgi:hypothetical protein